MTENDPDTGKIEEKDVQEDETNQQQSSQKDGKAPEEVNKVEEEEEEEVEMVEVPKSRLEELTSAEERFMEELKRERAESINYRKKLQKQRDEFVEFASAGVLTKLLAVKDDLKRIFDNISQDQVPQEHYEALSLLSQRVEGIFEQEGVSLIKVDEGQTRYDPKFHEAIVAQPIDSVEPNTIIEVVSQGFQKGKRVLRPAKVVISKKPPEPKPPAEDKKATSTDEETGKSLKTKDEPIKETSQESVETH